MNNILQTATVSRFIIGICMIGASLIAVPVAANEDNSTESSRGGSVEETIASLTATIAIISETIRTSDDIPPEEKLVLYSQLVQLSQAISAVRREAIANSSTRQTASQVAKIPLSDSSIHRVVMNLDFETFEAEVVIYEKTDTAGEYATTTRSVSLEKPDTGTFEQQVRAAKEELTQMLSNELGVITNQLFGATYVSAQNPLLVQGVIVNSDEAELLSEQFGRYSTIVEVRVLAGADTAKIIFNDDQNQSVHVTLTRQPREEFSSVFFESPDAEREYDGRLEFYILNDYRYRNSEDSRTFPVAATSITDATEEELLEFIVDSLASVPFAESIPNVEKRLLSFLLDNTARFVVRESLVNAAGLEVATAINYPQDVSEQCISPTDAIVMNEFILQALLDLRAQFIYSDGLFSYEVPIYKTDSYFRSGCENVRDYF